MPSDSRRPRNRLLASAAIVCATAAAIWATSEDAYSNIHQADYVGPEACRDCHEENHAENYDAWNDHSHRVMNQNPSEESVLGDFSGVELHYALGHVEFHRDGDDYVMSMYEKGYLSRRFVVTRTVGSLYVQYYIGKQVRGPEPRNHEAYRNENKLPFGYSVALDRWLPEIYFDSTVPAERYFLPGGPQANHIFTKPPTHNWNLSCMQCHNTYAYEARLWKQPGAHAALTAWRGGFPEESIEWKGQPIHQGRAKIRVGLRGLHGDELVTLGISCESCHFGGREHVENGREIRFVPASSDLSLYRPGTSEPIESDREDPLVINSICTQCHTAKLNLFADGSQAVNSSEGIDLQSGACASVIKCTDCHNPHEPGEPSGTPQSASSVDACLKCHPEFEEEEARAAHSRHDADVSCLECHMPRIVAGLDTVVRSHRISVPVRPAMARAGGPNGCNICHLDESMRWTVSNLESTWGREAPEAALAEAAYDVDRPMGEVWLDSRNRFVRMLAGEAYARSSLVEEPLPYLLETLNDEHAFTRTLGLIRLERFIGRRLSDDEFDLISSPDERAAQVSALREGLARDL